MFESIRLWWKFDGRYYHKDFVRGIKNLWRWFPTIWKDRDWDQDFIYNLLAKKLEFQAEYIGNRGFHREAKRDAERMRLVVRLIKLQQEEFYRMEYMDYQESKHWFEPCEDHPGYSEWKKETLSERFDEYFKKYPRQYKKVISGEINRFSKDIDFRDKERIAMEIAYQNQERCKNLIFSIMNGHIERWWD